ncbi:MAG: Ribosome-associated protein [Sporanaerobacter sp.]|jgi:ribosome-associated protein|uniref:RNA-binding S4 domain-containing protein n=1 Tax=Sporanaerobacter sp. TaxID=2010183 RepID=UPI003A0FD8E8
MKEIKIDTEYIKLDQFLKYIGVVQTGGQGKILIEEKNVEINGEVVTERGKKIRRGDKIKIKGVDDFVVI